MSQIDAMLNAQNCAPLAGILSNRPLGRVRAFLFAGLAWSIASVIATTNAESAWAAAGPVSQTNYDSVPPGSDSYPYWDEQVKSAERVQYVPDPAGQRSMVQRIEVKSGDTNVAGSSAINERAEVTRTSDLGGFIDGQTVVMSWGVLIDSSYNSPASGWSIFSQIHAAGGGNSPVWSVNLQGNDGNLQMGFYGGGSWLKYGQPDGAVKQRFNNLGPLSKNQWHDFVLKLRFSCAGDGHAVLWLDGQPLVNADNQAIGYCGDPGMYWKQGVYRAANDSDMTLWFSNTYRWASVEDAFVHYGWDNGGGSDSAHPPDPAPPSG